MSQSSISTSMMKLPVLLIFCFTTLVNSLDFKNNGYSNVVISISPDVPESQLIIDNIMVSYLWQYWGITLSNRLIPIDIAMG